MAARIRSAAAQLSAETRNGWADDARRDKRGTKERRDERTAAWVLWRLETRGVTLPRDVRDLTVTMTGNTARVTQKQKEWVQPSSVPVYGPRGVLKGHKHTPGHYAETLLGEVEVPPHAMPVADADAWHAARQPALLQVAA